MRLAVDVEVAVAELEEVVEPVGEPVELLVLLAVPVAVMEACVPWVGGVKRGDEN